MGKSSTSSRRQKMSAAAALEARTPKAPTEGGGGGGISRAGTVEAAAARRDTAAARKRDAMRDDEKRPKRRKHRSDGYDDSRSESEHEREEPETLARSILEKFPDTATDLEQLLQMIDNGQGVDVRGLSDKSLVKNLEKLFVSLKLKQNESGVFLLPPLGHRTLDVIGPLLGSHLKSRNNHLSKSGSPIREQSSLSDPECGKVNTDAARMEKSVGKDEEPPTPPRRRVIGPEMPSRELLAAAAELTEAETLLREVEMEVDNDMLIGPPPPAVVAEAESANEAERFEEVARIADAEAEKPYDVLGVNWKMSSDNIKKRYWKLSLLVHPDKCSHPQAQEAFVKLNQAFKDLQNPTKREAIDEKIKLKEQQEQFKAELQQLREAAHWRRLQGISMEGDEELLAVEKEPPKRDEWMTTLPPERKPGVTTQSTRAFSRTTKEGRGDTSAWTDSPLDRAQAAKKNYLEAYDRAKALADTKDRKKSSDADLVDKYNLSRRSISLVQKHQEEGKKQVKKSKQTAKKEKEKEVWVGQHPWKPWDRENDLTAGRQKVNLGMAEGLSLRFLSGTVQRNFL